jgi:hypothetical protein
VRWEFQAKRTSWWQAVRTELERPVLLVFTASIRCHHDVEALSVCQLDVLVAYLQASQH